MKKKIAILLAFMMILSTMCSLTLVSAEEPSAEAPIYNFVVGETDAGWGNIADGKELFEGGSWDQFESGMFPMTLMVDNTTAARGGTFVITYDPAKVTLMTYKSGKGGGWVEATDGSTIWFSSEFSSSTGVGTNAEGFGTEDGRGYAYVAWAAIKGEFDAEAIQANNENAEIGCFVFQTNEGVTINDFDENTFKLYEGLTSAAITEGLSSGGSPLSFNVGIDGVERKFGVTDSYYTREPMTVNFIYPNSTPAPVETFTVTFVADGVTVKEITKNAGETVTTAEFPAVPEKDGFIGVWNVTTDITATTTVTAQYTPVEPEKYTVTFLNEDGSVYQEIEVNVGSKLAVADFPAVPEKEGFTGAWDVTEDITAATTVRPVYTPVSEQPSAEAPIYNFVVGETDAGYGNIADGKELFEGGSWDQFESGMFPMTLMVDNTTAARGGTFVITYDPAKVTLMTYKSGKGGGWVEATDGSTIWFSSEFSSSTGVGTNAEGFGTENGRGYAYVAWAAIKGEFDAEAIQANNENAEIGCFVFQTNEGVTINDFDENTFKLYEGLTSAAITEGLSSGGSPLSFNVGIDGVERKFGVTDSYYTREPMTVNFIYPNSTPAPVETFTVTFVADGVTVQEITKNAGETVTTAEFPAVPEKDGFIGVWDVTTDITTTTTVTARYTPVAAGEVTLSAIFTDGFVKDYTFDPDTKTYSLEAIPGNADYVIAGYTDDENVASITYSIDDGAYEPANTENAYYFKLTRGQKSSVKIKLTDKAGGEVIYTFEVLIPGAANEVPLFETSGFELDNFDPAVREYTVTADPDETYVRLWGKAAAVVDGDDQRTIEYAVGDATDDPADMTYEALAVNCDQREDTYFAGTPNFDVNWSEKGFVTLWTEDGLSGKAMFVKVMGEGNPEPGYYKIIFE